ncbi:unnamed protein product [Diamesa serratosioi]
MPIEGVLGKDVDSLQFRWTSLRTMYTIFFLFTGTIESSLVVIRLVRLGLTVGYAEGIIFFVSSMVRAFMIFQMARKWKMIMTFWTQCEYSFLRSPYRELTGWSLPIKIRITGAFFIFLFFIEHIMYMSTSSYDNYLHLKYCNISHYQDFFKNYLATNRPHLMHAFPYSAWELPLYEWNNLLIGFAWNYSDVFIIIISIGLSHRFDQYNKLLERITNQHFEKAFWETLRMDYVKLCELVQFIDTHTSSLILLSTSHNVFIILLKIFNGLKHTRLNTFSDVYFWFYCSFLTIRTCSMFFIAGSIYELSRKPLRYIRKLPEKTWCVDLKRLSDTVQAEIIALSGKRFFYLTKGLILSIAGTIVKYELVLLDQVDNVGGEFDICIHLNR